MDAENKAVAEHRLKTLSPYFDAVASGVKTFEVRRHDRPFKVGDILQLDEVAEIRLASGETDLVYTGAVCRREIMFLLEGGQFGIEPGYCVLALGDL